MNKKSQGLSLNTIMITAIVLIVLVVLWAIFTGRMGLLNPKFNPEKDECDEWINGIYSTDHCDEEPRFIGGDINKWMCLDDQEGSPYTCKSWHPKSKCQLDPNAEDCVCDEYETKIISNFYDSCETNFKNESEYLKHKYMGEYSCRRVTYLYFANGEHFTIDEKDKASFIEFINNDVKLIEINCRYINCRIDEEVKTCIKAHEPNECEKGNENYVWDCPVELKPPIAKSPGGCGATICRKKTIQDMGCDNVWFEAVEYNQFGGGYKIVNKDALKEYIDRCAN